ncbi:MAG: carboxypeptidase-like regulatory domain-containing protein [Planctomycetaceae bacterium]
MMNPGIFVSGEIEVPEALIRKAKKNPKLYWNFYSDEFNGRGGHNTECVPTTFQDGKLLYQLPAVGVGRIELRIFDTNIEEQITESRSDLNFRLKAPPIKVVQTSEQPGEATEKESSSTTEDNQPQDSESAEERKGDWQQVIVDFKSDDEQVRPGGTLVYSFSLSDQLNSEDYPEYREWGATFTQPLVQGTASFEVPDGGQITFYTSELIGYRFTESDDQQYEVSRNIDSNSFTIPVIPSGMVRGRVTDSNGNPVANAKISMNYIKDYFSMEFFSTSISCETNSGKSGDYLVNSVPLDKKYSLEVSDGLMQQQMSSVQLKSWNPISQVDIQFGSPVNTTVQILNEQEQPVQDVEFQLQFCRNIDRHYNHLDTFNTNQHGIKTLYRLNSAENGNYYLSMPNSTSGNLVPLDLLQKTNTFYLVNGNL